jgi:hypothetical protein
MHRGELGLDLGVGAFGLVAGSDAFHHLVVQQPHRGDALEPEGHFGLDLLER